MGTAFTPANTSPASWDAFSDVDAFIDAVLAELVVMAGTWQPRSGLRAPLTDFHRLDRASFAWRTQTASQSSWPAACRAARVVNSNTSEV